MTNISNENRLLSSRAMSQVHSVAWLEEETIIMYSGSDGGGRVTAAPHAADLR